jgi:peptide/nickel transport system ATP-binding protein/oligopeptide transport system ATP-binding protein
MAALLEVEHLVKHFVAERSLFGRPIAHIKAVDGVSFHVDAGETLALVGESGCGKSTVSRLVLRLIEPDAGRIRFDGRNLLALDADALRAFRRQAQLIFQDPYASLNPRMTVSQILGEPLALHDLVPVEGRRARVEELLRLVGLDPRFARRYPHEFSGGMRQRAAIAMALACNPSVLVADEPTTALDVMVQAQILELLDSLCRDFGLALLLVTHDLPVVAQLCDHAAVMYAGEIVEQGPVDALFHDPRHPYTRLLFEATPDLLGNGVPVSIPGSPPRLDRPLHGCPFQPRCDRAFDRCTAQRPLLRGLDGGREAACHLNDLAAVPG